MRPGEGGGGPFAYYPVTGAAVRDAADSIGAGIGDLDAIRRQVERDHRQVMAGVTGDVAAPMADAPAPVRVRVDRVAEVSQFAAGVLRMFADAIDEHDHYSTSPRSVDALNLAYSQARLSGDPAATPIGPGGSLTREYHRLGEQLDAWADHAARMLGRGPNLDDIRELWASGALPSDASTVWPDLSLGQVPLLRLPYDLRESPDDRRSLYDLDRDELLELAEDGFEPAAELVSDRVADEFEDGTALRELDLSLNLTYLDAIANGMPEDIARALARIYPANVLDTNLAPLAAASRLAYRLTARDLVKALREDPVSLRALAEVGMVTPFGKAAKVRKLDELLDAIDDARDAERAADAGDDARRTVRIGGPDEFEPNSLRGMDAEDVRASIPDDWAVTPSRTGEGVVFRDPANNGRHIRIMPGYSPGSRPDQLTTGPYAVISQNGDRVKIPLAGNPTLG